jgi:alkylhydroperoxidase family enzyme
MARLPYVSRESVPPDKRHIYDHIAETRGGIEGGGIPRSFQLLMNSPDAAEAVGQLGEYIRLKSSLDPVIREIAILGTARALNSQYEWTHHEPVARRVGVREEVIAAIKSGKAPMGLPPKEGVFAQAAKELVLKGALSDRTFQAIEHLLGPDGTVQLIVVISYYAMLHRALASMGIELEPGLEPLLPE